MPHPACCRRWQASLAGQGSAAPVHLRDQVAVGSPGRFEVVAAFGKLAAQLGVVLLQASDLLLEGADVGGCAEAGLMPCLLAEQLR